MRKWRKLGDAALIGSWAAFALQAYPLDMVVGLPFLFVERRAFGEFRQWTLNQLAAAAAYLLGPDEPVVAGETSLYRSALSFGSITAHRDLSVVVTAAHVMVLRFDQFDGQPRSVELAAQARHVHVAVLRGVLGARPTIRVRHGSKSWSIQGMPRVLQSEPVVAAWKSALAAPVRT